MKLTPELAWPSGGIPLPAPIAAQARPAIRRSNRARCRRRPRRHVVGRPGHLREAHVAATAVAVSLAPNVVWLHSSHAGALMTLGQIDAARAIYRRHKGPKDGASDAGRSWNEDVVG
jgi:hypothetical protein